MASGEPVDIDRDGIGDEDVKWDDDVVKDLRSRFGEIRQYNRDYNKSCDEAAEKRH